MVIVSVSGNVDRGNWASWVMVKAAGEIQKISGSCASDLT